MTSVSLVSRDSSAVLLATSFWSVRSLAAAAAVRSTSAAPQAAESPAAHKAQNGQVATKRGFIRNWNSAPASLHIPSSFAAMTRKARSPDGMTG